MTDHQCGLCLSCGAPFLPEIDQVDFFNREANLSVLFLNTQFKRNPDIQRMYHVPKLCSERQASHVFHKAYHRAALDYMCNRYGIGDHDVGPAMPPPGPGPVVLPPAFAPGTVVRARPHEAFLYYHTETGKQGTKAACWARPAEAQRVRMDDLYRFFIFAAVEPELRPVEDGLDRTYDICMGCNSLMTQKSHMRYMLGCRNAGAKNTRGCIVPVDSFVQVNMNTAGHLLDSGYGHWNVNNNPAAARRPRRLKTDSDAPAIAYYLHMCLPFMANPNIDAFQAVSANVRQSARKLYIQQCWLILEIACLATLLEDGTVTKVPRGSRSHGLHQHRGVLDFYVSFFIWRLVEFRYGSVVQSQGLDFVQWHQKYFADARNCPWLLDPADRQVPTGQLMYASTALPSKILVERICAKLMGYVRGGPNNRSLNNLILHVMNQPGVPQEISDYFLPTVVVRILKNRSQEVLSDSMPFFVSLV